MHEPERCDTASQDDVTLKHFRSVCQRVAMMDRNKMLINFELVAMHLSCLLKGQDYPCTLEAFAEMHNL